ncbi:response regulator transcription factor [Streptomyces endophyticus]|uniref:Response regulator transcription factor n=1 Tax=Streptomyces endophyticus TaxID=714166 RepID=A0ABU6F309_9ACTN|nr:response regulator transcription factor [Streptomyces endophyticus]MEB8338393.1 response regulator transcription factor [Streptomyces endophyticus]
MHSSDNGRFRRALLGCGDSIPAERAATLCKEILGLDAVTAVTAAELVERAADAAPDLVISVTELPDGSAIDVVRELRGGGDTVPVVLLTRHTESNRRVAAFAAGADDYIVVPADATEIQMRIRALIRRCVWEREAAVPKAEEPPEAGGVHVGDIALVAETRTVTRNGTAVEMTPTEYGLLEFLMAHPRQVLSRQQILAAVWGPHHQGRDAVDTYIRYLRRKLDPLGPAAIHTKRGYGYVFDPEREA